MRLWAWLLGLLLLLNAGFLGIRLAGEALPKDVVVAAVAEGLASGALSTEDFVGTNPTRGLDQWTDCLSLELAAIEAGGGLLGALAPRVLPPDVVNQRCARLAAFVAGTYRAEEYPTYTRFWHGHATLTAAALQVMPLGVYRALLTMLCYGAVAAAGVAAAFAGREVAVPLLPLFAWGFAGSGIYYLGALVSHAPAFVAVWLMAGLILLRGRTASVAEIAALALVAGAVEAFVDTMLLCPLSAALTVLAANQSVLVRRPGAGLGAVLRFNAVVLTAWVLGFAGTYVLKVVMTAAVLGWDPVVGPFVAQVLRRAGLGAPGELPTGLVAAFKAVYWKLFRLVFIEHGQHVTVVLVAGSAVLGWLAAFARAGAMARRGEGEAALVRGIGFILPVLVVCVWIAVFSEHTIAHGSYTVRSTIVALAGGWCWLVALRMRPA